MRLTILTFILTSIITLKGQEKSFSKLDRLIEKWENKNLVMGSLSFTKNGDITYSKAFGFSDISTNAKAKTTTKYRIGSVSKIYTSAIILQLENEKLLDLDKAISEYLPSLTFDKKVTIEYLLRHESGIYNFGKSKNNKYSTMKPQDSGEILEIINGEELIFTPGTKVDYNNANYVILSLLIEKLDKVSFAESFNKRIINPLKLTETHSGKPINTNENEANSYYWKKAWVENSDNYSPTLLGAGALVSSANEVNLFLNALFNFELIPKSQLNKMIDFKENMGLGIYKYPFFNKVAYGHGGNIDAFESFSVYFPEEKVSFTLLLNGNRDQLNHLLIECLSVYFGY